MRSIVRRVLNARRDFMAHHVVEPSFVYMGPDDYLHLKQEMFNVMMMLDLTPAGVGHECNKIAGLELKLTPYNGIAVR